MYAAIDALLHWEAERASKHLNPQNTRAPRRITYAKATRPDAKDEYPVTRQDYAEMERVCGGVLARLRCSWTVGDLVSATWLKMQGSTWDPSKSSRTTWVHVIARNLVKDRIRYEQRQCRDWRVTESYDALVTA